MKKHRWYADIGVLSLNNPEIAQGILALRTPSFLCFDFMYGIRERAVHSVTCTCLSWAFVKYCVCPSFPFGIEGGWGGM